MNVLVVDDSDDVRFMLRVFLETLEGVAGVTEARDGLEGIRAAEATMPDVVLLDVEMPIMNGFDALPLVRRAAPEARILVYTALPVDLQRRALALGANVIVSKSVSLQHLRSKMIGVGGVA